MRKPNVKAGVPLGGALLILVLSTGCTFYTSCPDNPGPGAQTGGTGNNQGGAGSGVMPGDEENAEPWVIATSNLEGVESECGNLGTVSVKADEDWVIASVARVGLFVSRDGDPDWAPLGEGEDSELLDNRTQELVFDPDDPARFWQAGAYGGCVYQTIDHGDTFQQLGEVTHCDTVAVDFSDAERNTLLAGGHEGRNLYESLDGGMTWEDVGPNIQEDAGFTGFASIVAPDNYLVASFSGEGSGIFRSEDGGDNWSRVWEGGIRSRPLFAADEAIYWVLSNQDGDQGLVRSEDQGQSWAKVEGSNGILSVEHALVELPDDRIATIGFTHLIISDDYGKSWREIGKKLPYTPHGMTYSPVRKQFYIWKFDCGADPNAISSNAIMTLSFDYEAE